MIDRYRATGWQNGSCRRCDGCEFFRGIDNHNVVATGEGGKSDAGVTGDVGKTDGNVRSHRKRSDGVYDLKTSLINGSKHREAAVLIIQIGTVVDQVDEKVVGCAIRITVKFGHGDGTPGIAHVELINNGWVFSNAEKTSGALGPERFPTLQHEA